MASVRDYTDQAFADDRRRPAVVVPYTMSHGTLALRDMAMTRRFYEDFLGMSCVQHGSTSMAVRCGVKFHIVCLQLGEHAPPAGLHNHWGLDVESPEAVDEAYRQALAAQKEYRIKSITKPLKQHGAYSFYIEDLDSNYWEIQYYPGFQHDDMFDFGDRFTLAGDPVQ